MLSDAKPMALKAAVKLNIPDILAMHGNGNPMNVDHICSYIYGTANKDNLFRILRLLASIGVFSEEEESPLARGTCKQYKYGLTKLSESFIKKDNPRCYAPTLLLITDKAVLEAYQLLHESVTEGCCVFNNAHGMNLFDYASNNPEFNNLINQGVTTDSNALIDREEGGMRRTGLLFDLYLMAYTPGGREITEEEFKELFEKAGFKSYTVIKLPFLQALIEVSK